MSGLAQTAESIRVRLVEMLAAISGRAIATLIGDFAAGRTPGVADLGLDTRQLKQLAQNLQTLTGVRISVWQMLDEFTTLDALVEHLADSQGAPSSEADAGGRRIHIATPLQAAHLADLDARLAARLPRSRQVAAEAAAQPNDSGPIGHEIPLVILRAAGARLHDVDGHDYIDLACDDAQLLLGHVPPLVRGAIAEQLERSSRTDAAPELASAAAMQFMRLTGSDGTRFFASADSTRDAAIRSARKLRGRQLIAAFRGPSPVADDASLADGPVHWLDYASGEALDWIRSHRDEIAAVLVEMVQPHRAGFHPRRFLRELQVICEVARIPFLLDETLTSLRIRHELKPDLSIHGRSIAAGLSIGALAGRTASLAAVDAEIATASGIRGEPLALAAADAVLVHWTEQGPAQIAALDRRTRRLADGIDALFKAHGLRTRVAVFGSLFHVDVAAEHPLATLLHAHLRLRGVHLLPGHPGCLSTAHGDAEIDEVLAAFRDSLAELAANGVFGSAEVERLRAAEAPPALAETAPMAGFMSAALRPVSPPTSEPAAPPAAAIAAGSAEPAPRPDAAGTQLLASLNRTEHDYPRQHCLQQLIEARAWAAPDSPAVRCGEQRLSYRALNEQSSRLANLLCWRAPETGPVLVQVEPSCARVVTLLAVLKAGRAWLAIDPGLSAEEGLRLMIEQHASALITDRSGIGDDLLGVIPSIELDVDAAAIAASSAGRPKVRPDAEAVAWWLARPDGGHARIPHRALVNLLISLSAEPRFLSEDVLYAVAAPGSSLELIELLLPLVVGGQLVLGAPDGAWDGRQLQQHLETAQATTLLASPEIISSLLDAGFRARGAFRLLCNGPRLDRALANRVHAAGSTELWALHGAVDAAVWSLIERVLPYDATISLGRPLANTQVQVLDERLQPVALGETGRLYIGGDGLARDDLDPAAADRHIGHPFGPGRLLRTDDRVSLLADGRLHWQGKAMQPLTERHTADERPASPLMPTLAAQLVTGFNVWLVPPASDDAVDDAALPADPFDEPIVASRFDLDASAGTAQPDTEPVLDAVEPAVAKAQVPTLQPDDPIELAAEPDREEAVESLPAAIVETVVALPETVEPADEPAMSIDLPNQPEPAVLVVTTEVEEAIELLPETPAVEAAAEVGLDVPDVTERAPEPATIVDLRLEPESEITVTVATEVDAPADVPEAAAEPDIAALAPALVEPAVPAADPAPLLVQPAAVVPPPVPVTPFDPSQRCSSQQQVLWLLDRLEPGSAALAHLLRCSIHGPVERLRLEQAWLLLIERHASLRRLFDEQDGQLRQRLLPQPLFALGDVDLSTLPLAERHEATARIADIEALTPFDLGHGPLLRATLLREAAEHSTLLVCAHPIVADRLSLALLVQELAQVYQALESDAAVELPPAGDYADYCSEQQDAIDLARLAADQSYWQRQLAGARPLRLAHDHAEPLLPGTRSGVLVEALSPSLVLMLTTAARRSGVGIDDLVLGGLALLLARMSGETDLLIAGRHADRDPARHGHTIGAFERPLLLRLDLSDDPVVATLASRIQTLRAEAIEHRQLPLERQLAMLDRHSGCRSRSRLPIAFVVETDSGLAGGAQRHRLPWLEIEEHRQLGTPHDLEFVLREQAGRWELACRYRSELNNRSTIDHLLGNLLSVLAQIASGPDLALPAIEPIEADERRRLLSTATGRLLPAGRIDVFGRYSIQVTQRPEAEAVRCGNQRLSYRQLEFESSRIAALIRTRIVDTIGARIGICLPRSTDLLVLLLATMRLGASWVMVDGNEPAERLADKMADAELSLLVVRSSSGLVLPGNIRQLIDLDVEAPLLREQTNSGHDVTVPADYEACLYHHGIGSPALAFRLSCGGVADRLMALADRPGLRAGEVVLATTPAHLETSLIELLLPLMVGARIVIATESECRDGRLLQQLLFQQRSQSLVLVGSPLLCQRLLLGGWGGHPPLRVWTSGEMSPPALNERLLGYGCELWRLHGAPGAAICAGVHRVSRADDRTIISDVAAGVVVRVLGPQRQLLPIGSSGELHLGGSALALGRLRDDDEQQETDRRTGSAHVRDPYSDETQARLLATGERVRLRGPQTFELLGRQDRIVQIDGQVIDPADIEALLCGHPDVAAARVRIIARGLSAPAVKAWLVLVETPASPPSQLPEALTRQLARQLAAIWRPSEFEIVEQLPAPLGLTLEADLPEWLGGPSTLPAIAAISATEQRLAALWRELLELPAATLIPPGSSFFELGGHSLLAARLLGRIESQFGRRATLATLHQAPGLRALAHWLDRGEVRDFDFRQIVRLQTLGNRPPIIAISNTGLYGALARRLGHAQPFTALQVHDPAQPRIDLPRTLEDTATAYLQLIRRLHPLGPKLLISAADSAALAFEVARQLSLGEPVPPLLVLLDAERPQHVDSLSPLRRVVIRQSQRLQARRAATPRLSSAPPLIALPTESHDQWLRGHLARLSATYEPEAFEGRILLIRARGEATGWWADPLAGWGGLARQGVIVERIASRRAMLLEEPAVSKLAELISRHIDSLRQPAG